LIVVLHFRSIKLTGVSGEVQNCDFRWKCKTEDGRVIQCIPEDTTLASQVYCSCLRLFCRIQASFYSCAQK
jgi:hypothetical protein